MHRHSRFVFAAAVPSAVLTCVAVSAPRLRVPVLTRLEAREQTASTSQQLLPPVAEAVWNSMRPLDVPHGVSISDSRVIRLAVGEVQSAVVPPDINPACPNGRLMISSDAEKSPGKIALIGLEDLDASPAFAAFDLPPGWGDDRRILSNDHDLVTLPNGHVLFLKMGQTKAELDPEPAWFDYAYKRSRKPDKTLDIWGPGARSEMLVWRSENCGADFHFVSGIDTALLDDGYGTPDDGSGGLPQGNPYYGEPGTDEQPIFQMGGTDGPLTRVDPSTGRVFVTLGLVGKVQDGTKQGFWLSTRFLSRTVVMTSSDNGSSWDRAALLHLRPWRLDVVPRPDGTLAFGHSGGKNSDLNQGLSFVVPGCAIGCVVSHLGSDAFEPPDKPGHWGWTQPPDDHLVLYLNDVERGDFMGANLLDRGILTRSPSSSNLLFAHMDTIDGQGDGYRLWTYDGVSSWQPLEPIVPESSNPGNFTMHVTPIDPGRGPVFFYWYDVNVETNEVTMRGKLVTDDNQETVPFAVSRSGTAKRSFDVSTERRWYGDYHTAGGYVVPDGSTYTYYYYPVWLEPDGQVRFARVKYEAPLTLSDVASWLLGYRVRSATDTIILRELADLLSLEPDRAEEEEEDTIRER